MEDDEDKEEPAPLSVPKPAAAPVAQSAIDVTAEFLRPLLNSENVANLVRSSSCFAPSDKQAPLTHFGSSLGSDPGADQHGVSPGCHASVLPGHLHARRVSRHRRPNQTSGQADGHADDCSWDRSRYVGNKQQRKAKQKIQSLILSKVWTQMNSMVFLSF